MATMVTRTHLNVTYIRTLFETQMEVGVVEKMR
jgi:hypothetical protein